MRCNRTAVALAGAALLAGGPAAAFLDTGTLLTNSASATYQTNPYSNPPPTVSYSATAKILVANPAIFMWKDGTPTQVTASVGGTVDFSICFSNGGANTAFRLTIKDKLPNNTYYYGNYSMWRTTLTGTVSTAVGMTYSQTSADGPWFEAQPSVGTGQPLWLQWVIPDVGVGKSGCIFFSISVGV